MQTPQPHFMTSKLLNLIRLPLAASLNSQIKRRMAVAATDSSLCIKGRGSFSVDPAKLTAKQKKELITRNLEVRMSDFKASKGGI